VAKVTRQHPNASLTPSGRHKMVLVVIDEHWSIEATADRFQVDAKTVRKWRDRYLSEGLAGLQDRSSRPHRSPNRTKARLAKRVLHLRRPAAGVLTGSLTTPGSPRRRCRAS
jgi:transposase-like protein